MINVEWESSVIQHGRHQGKLKSSTVHGWLVKMRGTIVGDEKMRWQGIEEMKSAARHRKRNAAAPRRKSSSVKKSSGGNIFSIFGSKKHTTKPAPRSRSGGSTRPAPPRRAQTLPAKRSDNRPPVSRRPSAPHHRRPSVQSRRPSQSTAAGRPTRNHRSNTR